MDQKEKELFQSIVDWLLQKNEKGDSIEKKQIEQVNDSQTDELTQE